MKYKYTTLKGLISRTNQFSLSSYIGLRIFHKKKGHIDIKLTEELNDQINKLFCDFLGLYEINYYNNYGIFERLIINKNLKVEYIAGQDYLGELRYIKKLLKGEAKK